jgi:pterin-4a-carbinolamine dehydratase
MITLKCESHSPVWFVSVNIVQIKVTTHFEDNYIYILTVICKKKYIYKINQLQY